MQRCLFALAFALCGSAAAAQVVDTQESTDCRQALDPLQAQEAAVLAARQADEQSDGSYQRARDHQLEQLRRNAARACFAGRADSPPLAPRSAQRPTVVPPIAVVRPALPPALPTAPVAPSPMQVAPRPTVVVACDLSGCWANDGSRLMRVGPNLLGPRGFCSLQGTLLQCPP